MAEEKITEKSVKMTKDQYDALKKLTSATSEYDKATQSLVNSLKKAAKEGDSVKNTEKAFEKMQKYVLNTSGRVKELDSSMRNLVKSLGKLELSKLSDQGAVKEITNQVTELYKEIGIVREESKKGLVSPEDTIRKIEQIQSKIDGLTTNLNEMSKTSAGKFIELGKTTGKFISGFRTFTPEGMKQASEAGGILSKKLLDANVPLGKMPKLMGLVGKSIKGLGGALGGFSKALLGWPGLIIMGLKKLADAYLAIDDFVKNANKAFASVRGPDIMTGDIKQQFRDFNSAIYDISDNIRDGLDVDQIRGFMEAVHQAGLRIGTLNEGLLGYRDAIHVAAKASRTLGMELPRVGSIMGDLMTEYRMDLTEVDQLFTQVAFDAKKTGLSTEKFWGAIQNASASLAIYGLFIGNAAKAMKGFSEAQIGGAKDSEEATTDMFQRFKEGSLAANAALLQFARINKVDINKHFADAAKDFRKQAEGLDWEIETLRVKADAAKSPDELRAINDSISKLTNEQSSLRQQADRAQKLADKREVAQATDMGLLAAKAPEILTDVLKGIAGVQNLSEIEGQKMAQVLQSIDKFGISEKTVRMLVNLSGQTNQKMGKLLGTNEDGKKYAHSLLNITEKFGESQIEKYDASAKEQLKVLGTLSNETDVNNQIKQGEQLSKNLQSIFGMDKQVADAVVQVAKVDADSGKNIENMLSSSVELSKARNVLAQATENNDAAAIEKAKQGVAAAEATYELDKKQFDNTLKANSVTQKIATSSITGQEIAQKEAEKNAEDTMKKMVTQTLSMRDIGKITKDGVMWQGVMVGKLDTLTGLVDGIAIKYLGSDYESPSQKKARETLTALGITFTAGFKSLTAIQQKMLISKGMQKIAEKEEEISGIDETVSVLKTLRSKEDITQRMNEELGKDEKKQNKGLIKVLQKGYSMLEKKTKITAGDMVSAFGDQVTELEKNRAIASDELEKEKNVITSLGELNTANQGQIKLLQELLLTQPGVLKDFITEIKGKSFTKKELAAKYKEKTGKDMDPNTLIRALKAQGELGGVTEFKNEKKYKKYMNMGGPNESELVIKDWQSLTTPIEVTSPGVVKLDPKEMVFPSPDRAAPGAPMIAEPPAGAGAGVVGEAGKTITINVNATERDLAQRIANEVRGVLYREQLTGAG